MPLAAAYLILIHLTPSLLSRSLPIFRLGKSADGWNRHRWRDAGGKMKRKGGRKTGEGEEEILVRRRHRQFNGRVSRHKIWRPLSGRFSKNHCTSKYWSRNFPADIRFPGVSCFNVIDLFHLSYTIHFTLMNRVSNEHTRPNRPRTEGICVDMLFLKNIKNIWNIKVAIFVIN